MKKISSISLAFALTLGLGFSVIFGANAAVASDDFGEVNIEDATEDAVERYYGEEGVDLKIETNDAQFGLSPEGLDGQSFTVTADIPIESTLYSDETQTGARLITTIHSEPLTSTDIATTSYEIDGIADPYLVKVDDAYKMLDANDRYVVDLAEPWAVDANGVSLSTEYRLEDNILTQTIDYTGAVFPVVADPAWNYSVDHASFYLITGKEKATPARVMAELRRCFNCSFPVAGAPKAFPALNQNITLNASPFSFTKIPAPVRVSAIVSNGFNFRALAGHFDGKDSTINFRFYNDRSGWLHISVSAHIKVDRGAAANAVNQAVAGETWAAFLANLIRRPAL
ncbi:hypothetical protein [Microbacterium sp.]|uniref:hypothetical protein n=1 Tax=Microbacterium sp. TaxID=51671 RepID=UPI0039E671D6